MLNKFLIGNYTDEENGTGVTVVISEEGAVAGCSIKGAAPATRETDLLRMDKTVQKINAVTLSGGSAFGLEASCGVMQWLHEKGCGFDTGAFCVPIVVGASLYDLEYKNFSYPNKQAGYDAANSATSSNFECGNIGAGTGATVGKILKMKGSMKGGLGIKTFKKGALEVAVIVAVNALGDIINEEGKIIAGAKIGKVFVGSKKIYSTYAKFLKRQNTTIACIITNADLTKAQANELAVRAHDGYDKSISPSHTVFDGDAIFVMASGECKGEFNFLMEQMPNLVAEGVRSVFVDKRKELEN